MKQVFTPITIVTATVSLLAGLLSQQASAWANSQSPLSPTQAAQLSRDLIPSQPQEFFRQGQERFEAEIQNLIKRQTTSTEPPLEINVNPQVELERLPQVQPTQSQ
ncbi:MAG TPA: hypothetical protein V6D14_03860 [Coleofasciculaceae cyanobacterium]|jgi:hypothetical protein